jgi:uncharacterized protein YabN with tetrapyrrole methylase and pyrophosphatase domain
MRHSGCYSIEYGIEAGSQRILDTIGKKISIEQIRRVVGETVKLGIDAEAALNGTTAKFYRRFRYVEEQYKTGDIHNASLEELDCHWEAAKEH